MKKTDMAICIVVLQQEITIEALPPGVHKMLVMKILADNAEKQLGEVLRK